MIILKTPAEIAVMAEASRVVAEALADCEESGRPGISTDELDRIAEEAIRSRGAIPAFKGYRNYPKTLCASVNEQVVHGIPSKRKLKEGDIIGLDLGAIVGGFYGDSAVTVAVGRDPGGDRKIGSSDGRGAVSRDQAGYSGQPFDRHLECGATACGICRLLGCHRVCRSWDWSAIA